MAEESNPRRTRVLSADERPGALPEITWDGLSVEYALVVRGSKDRVRLVLRCDEAGAVWASIRRAE